MTKRDVAVWFCRVIALVSLTSCFFNCLSNSVLWLTARSFGSLFYTLPTLLLYGFVWLLAPSIGTELAAEGEFGPSITSKADLLPLLLRCVGLMLLLSNSIGFFTYALQLGLTRFPHPATTMPAFLITQWITGAVSSFAQSAIGFALAFGPRIRAAMQPK